MSARKEELSLKTAMGEMEKTKVGEKWKRHDVLCVACKEACLCKASFVVIHQKKIY